MHLNIHDYFKNYKNSDFLFLNNGRTALQATIQEFNLQNSEIIIPSFICSDVFSPLFIQNNIKPVLIDCEKNNFNIALNNIKQAYNKNVKAVIIVHTFGQINKEILEISNWCKKNNLILIEDCAHCININFKNKFIGEFGNCSIFSFPKTLKTFTGGVYLKNNKKINLKPLPYKLNNLDIVNFIHKIPFNNYFLKLLKSFKSNQKITINPEKITITSLPNYFNLLSISNQQISITKRKKIAILFYNQLKSKLNNKEILFNIDFNNNFFFSIPILVKNRDKIFNLLIKNKINCTKMWNNPLSKDILLSKKYNLNKTPIADDFSEHIINFIVNIKDNEKSIQKQTNIISKIINQHT